MKSLPSPYWGDESAIAAQYNEGIVVGRLPGSGHIVRIPRTPTSAGHVLLLGSSGRGKTTGSVVPTLLTDPQTSAIICDTDYAHVDFAACARVAAGVPRIDMRHGFDPLKTYLRIYQERAIDTLALRIANFEGLAQHADACATALAGLLGEYLRRCPAEHVSFSGFFEWVSQTPAEHADTAIAQNSRDTFLPQYQRATAIRHASLNGTARLRAIASAQTALANLITADTLSITSRDGIDPEELCATPFTLTISGNPLEKSLAHLADLLICAFVDVQKDRPLNIFMQSNFARYMPCSIGSIRLARKRYVRYIFSCMNITDFQDLAAREFNLIDNFDEVAFFGSSDNHTAEIIRYMAGRSAEAPVPLKTSDVLQLPFGQALLLGNHLPIRMEILRPNETYAMAASGKDATP